MKYELICANRSDMDYLNDCKLYNIFNYAHNLPEEEISRIKNYVKNHIPIEINDYKIILCDNKKIGCCLVVKKEDGVLLDEIYIQEEYRNKGIGTNIITNILQNNSVVYLWVYKENVKAISLYKKLKFQIIEETDTRYYMKYSK